MLYFSYGSLDSETLRRHCPKAVYKGMAILPNWEVQFNFEYIDICRESSLF